jgi:benzoyl-CoA reductase/2-hydroxyglutaryl-CoA dehydratase subunit BcrC/BadD/HgdB
MNRMEEILDELCAISKNPKQQLDRYIGEGKKVIGCMPYFCPEELIYAGGMIPFGLWGAEIQTQEARRYWPAFICSILQTILELGIRGAYDALSAVMIPVLCDGLKGMDGNWRYGVPNVPVIPVAHAQNRKMPAGVEFTASQYRKIRHRLEEIAGLKIGDGEISEAVRVYNGRRAIMRRFAEASGKHPGLLSPSRRNAVYKSAYFMDVKEHMALTSELTALIEETPAVSFAGLRVVTSGIIADSSGLLRILDDCGIAVVADSVTHESVKYNTDVPMTEDPIDGMAAQLGTIEGCPVLFDPGKYRGTVLTDLVRNTGADGVLFVQTKFCDPEEYDEVPLKRLLEKAGIRSLKVEIDQQTVSYEQVRTALETFCEILRS